MDGNNLGGFGQQLPKSRENAYLDNIAPASEEGKEKENIKETIEELKKATVTHRNAKEFYEMIKNKSMMTETSISNLLNAQEKMRTDLKNILNIKMVKSMMETDQIIPLKVFEIFSEMYKGIDEMLIYKTLQSNLYRILNTKLYQSLQATKALDIEREVTQGLREIQGEYMNMIKEIVNEKFRAMDSKIEVIRDVNSQEMNSFQTNVYSKMVKDYEKINNANIIALRELTTEFNDKLADIYSAEKQQTVAIEKHIQQKPQPIKKIDRPLGKVINIEEEPEYTKPTRISLPAKPQIQEPTDEDTDGYEEYKEEIEEPLEDDSLNEEDEGEDGEDGENTEEEETIASAANLPGKKFVCSCGRGYNSPAALTFHKEQAGHDIKPVKQK
jgi:hypothetical protein